MSGMQQRQALDAIAAQPVISIEELVKATALPRPKATRATAELIRKGLVHRLARGRYRITAAGQRASEGEGYVIDKETAEERGPRKLHTRSQRQRAWTTMRILRAFTLPEVLTAIDVGERRPCERNLRKYFGALCRSGFIICTGRTSGDAPSSNGHKRYLVMRNDGPIAPVVIRGGAAVFDHNTETEHPCA